MTHPSHPYHQEYKNGLARDRASLGLDDDGSSPTRYAIAEHIDAHVLRLRRTTGEMLTAMKQLRAAPAGMSTAAQAAALACVAQDAAREAVALQRLATLLSQLHLLEP